MATVLVGFSATIAAQELARVEGPNNDLPEAPSAVAAASQSPDVQGSGRIFGLVLDINSAIVPGAKVTLLRNDAAASPAGERVAIADEAGGFSFTGLPAGRFKVSITAKGLQNFVSAEIVLKAGEVRELPQIALPIASATADVEVVVTEKELAQEQIRAEEKQRVLGVLPNFYSSYIWNAAPLTKGQKFGLGFRSIFDPTEFLGAAAIAGAQYEAGTFAGYGYGISGYGKRFAAAYGDGAVSRMVGSAILPALLHQDPRYFYKGSGSKKSRALYAIERAVITRGDSGRAEPNFSHLGGAFLGGAISNAYHPHADRGVGLVFTNGLIDTAGNALQNLVREFVLREVTPSVPDFERGKQ